MPPNQTLKTRKLQQFPSRCFIENILIRSTNNHILFTTFKDGSIFSLDPNTISLETTDSAHLIAQIPTSNPQKPLNLTGIVEISPSIFAVAGGYEPLPMKFERGSMGIWKVDLTGQGGKEVDITPIAEGIDTTMLNGMANLPNAPHILLALDSNEGRVFRIDSKTGKVNVVIQDFLLGPSEKEKRVPMGANGCKVRDGYLWFTNSGQRVFGRVKIGDDGSVKEKPEVLVSNDENEELGWSCDDFCFDEEGNAYVTVHSNSVYRISRDGGQELFAGGEGSDLLQEPTACALSKDETKLYVACAGRMGEFQGNIVEIQLKG